MNTATVTVDYTPGPVLTSTGPWTPILWDMDGTLLDSEVAIVRRLRETLEHFDVPVPPDDQLRYLIGPPAGTSLLPFVGPERIMESRAFYKSLAERDQQKDQTLFPWIPEILKSLHEAGFPMAVATSKPQHQAEAICELYGISQYFSSVVGANDARRDKAAVIAEGLVQLHHDALNPVMVGDRFYDTEGAALNNVPTILVRWGYAHEKEFAGAMNTVADDQELLSLLLGK